MSTSINGTTGIDVSAVSSSAITADRTTDDGTIIDLQKNGSSIGTLGIEGGDLVVDGGSGHVGVRFMAGTLRPRDAGTVSDGGVDLGASNGRWKDLYLSGGVYLGGTGSSNLLDDYEQGTWTPTIRGAGTAGTYTYEENQGHYVKIGNQVTAWINITNVTQSSAGSSTMRLEGLPFTCNWQSGFNGVGVGVLSVDGWSGIDGDYMVPTIGDNQSYITFYYMNGTNNDLTSLSITNLTESGTADIRGFVTYYTGG